MADKEKKMVEISTEDLAILHTLAKYGKKFLEGNNKQGIRWLEVDLDAGQTNEVKEKIEQVLSLCIEKIYNL